MIFLTKNLVLPILALLFFNSGSLYGSVPDSVKTYNLNEITVTAQRIDKKLIEVGRSVTLIQADDFQSELFLTPAELISNYEGVFVMGNGQNPGSLQSLYMRGAAPNQTVILLDGIRITDPSSVDNAIDLSELSFSNISRIEMIRGSHSTLYGSSAIGGVVNILTDKNKVPGMNADVILRGGTFGDESSEFSQNILLNYTTMDGFYFTGEVFNSRVNGIDATVDSITTPGIYKNPDKDGFDKLDMTGKIGYASNKLDLYLSYKKTDQQSDIDAGAFRDDENSTISFKRDLFSLGAKYNFSENISAKLISGLTKMRRNAVNDSSIIDFAGNYDQSYSETNFSGSVFNTDLQLNLSYNNIAAVIGAGYYKEEMNNKSYIYSNSPWGLYESRQDLDSLNLNTTLSNVFGYLDIDGRLIGEDLSNFNLAIGGRLNNHSKFGNQFTYEINPSYKVGSAGLIYLSYATGFNAPPLYRLFSPASNYISTITRGNENLKPEISNSFEAGFKYMFGSDVTITLSAFTTSVKNNIEYVYLWDKETPISELGTDWMRDDSRGDTYINIGTLNTKGFEVSASFALLENLSINANVSIIDGELKYKPEEIDTEHTQGNHVQLYSNGSFINTDKNEDGLVRRSNTVNFSLTYLPAEDLTLRLDAHYVGKRDDVYYDVSLGPWGALGTMPVSDYTLFDITAKYSLMENLIGTVTIKNLLDRNYYELRGYRTRGRGIYMGLRYSL
ncbi:MAG: TonB-dependent receptor [Bacteroidetes bacterium]|nr:TonB-dependent receptor [Bacteroidota bacterium]